jgi:hypothetical protein
MVVITQRPHPQMVSGAEQPALRRVPHRKREITQQMIDARVAPPHIRFQDQFAVRRLPAPTRRGRSSASNSSRLSSRASAVTV